jgi:hypothetical protein
MVNPQDSSLQIQAAMKNLSTNTVFYFVIPVDFESVLVPGTSMDVPGFAAAWKGLDESSEVSVVIKGTFPQYITFL